MISSEKEIEHGLFISAILHLIQTLKTLTIVKVKAHSGVEGNELANGTALQEHAAEEEKDKWKNHQAVTCEARIWKLKRKVIIPRMAVQHILECSITRPMKKQKH